MKTINETLNPTEAEEFVETESFTSSFAPINRTEGFVFGLYDRFCCLGLLVGFIAILRFLVSK